MKIPLGRDAMVLMLSWVAGGVDAISYLGLGHVFTANMTGNAVLLGLALGQGNGWAALRSIIALAGFVLGVAVAASIVERGPNEGKWPIAVTKAVALECIILALFSVAWNIPRSPQSEHSLYFLITLSAFAMGIQSAAMRHLNIPGIATTYITGTITGMVVGFMAWLWRGPISASPSPTATPRERKRGVRLQAAVLCTYVLAAITSSFFQARQSLLVTLSPLVGIGWVVVNAVLRHRYESRNRLSSGSLNN